MKKAALYLALLAAASREARALDPLPPISELIERAYPTWCIDSNENRLTNVNTCADGSPNGRFTPLYFRKCFYNYIMCMVHIVSKIEFLCVE